MTVVPDEPTSERRHGGGDRDVRVPGRSRWTGETSWPPRRPLFAERGFEATSMEAIAQRADVARPSVYEQFESKDALVVATIEDAAATVTQRVRLALGEPDGAWPDAVRHTIETLFTLAEEEQDALTILLLAEQSTSLPPESGLTEARQRMIGSLATMSRERWRAVGVEVGVIADLVALMVFTLSDALARRGMADGLDKAALMDLLTTFTIGGLVAVVEDPETLAALDGTEP